MARKNWTRNEVILAFEAYMEHWPRMLDDTDAEAIRLTAQINALPENEGGGRTVGAIIFRLSNFRAVDTRDDRQGFGNVSRLDREIWEEFHDDLSGLQAAAESIRRGNSPEPLPIFDYEEETEEGRKRLVSHYQRERDSKIVRRKKTLVRQATGTLACEVCRFDYAKVYGDIGEGFIECHHTVPVSELQEGDKTRLDDLVLLCANCHRMIHRRGLITTAELKARLSLSL